MKFPVIIADPPVPFKTWGKRPGGIDSRAAEAHYSTMSWEELNNLGPLVQAVAADNCALFLWLCQPLLIETLEMVKSWGFTYKTKAFSWVKTRGNDATFHVGMGYWTRANTEDVLLCTRGKPRRVAKNVHQIVAQTPYETEAVVAPLGRHSRKPEEVQNRVERLMAGPYLELFARRQRFGWTCLGNEIDGLDIREALGCLAAVEPQIDHPLTIISQTHLFDFEEAA